jgi:hypothetical protein
VRSARNGHDDWIEWLGVGNLHLVGNSGIGSLGCDPLCGPVRDALLQKPKEHEAEIPEDESYE